LALDIAGLGSPACAARWFRAEIDRQVHVLGAIYLLTYLFFGTMTLNEALRSLQLFATEVMPKLAQL
jgi:hypothetical protein